MVIPQLVIFFSTPILVWLAQLGKATIMLWELTNWLGVDASCWSHWAGPRNMDISSHGVVPKW